MQLEKLCGDERAGIRDQVNAPLSDGEVRVRKQRPLNVTRLPGD